MPATTFTASLQEDFGSYYSPGLVYFSATKNTANPMNQYVYFSYRASPGLPIGARINAVSTDLTLYHPGGGLWPVSTAWVWRNFGSMGYFLNTSSVPITPTTYTCNTNANDVLTPSSNVLWLDGAIQCNETFYTISTVLSSSISVYVEYDFIDTQAQLFFGTNC